MTDREVRRMALEAALEFHINDVDYFDIADLIATAKSLEDYLFGNTTQPCAPDEITD